MTWRAAAICAAAALAASAAAADDVAIRLRMVNASRHVIREAYVSPSGTPGWGPDLLRATPTTRGAAPRTVAPTGREELELRAPCGTFDVRLVAEGGTEYLVDEQELCGDEDVLTVTNDALLFRKAGRE